MNYYSDEKDILNLVSLLKAHNIKRAIVSPGSTNISLAASLLYDPDFEVYSAVDERSAAYMACGLAAETGEPVVISCTGATASRNYVPALTEAYYRKLPVIAITSSQYFGRVGHYFPQVTDRTSPLNDIVIKSVQIPVARCQEDEWSNNTKINDVLLECRRHGGGPVHINVETTFSKVFDVKNLPKVRVIRRVTLADSFPEIKAGRIAVFVGSHAVFDDALTREIDTFCANNNAIVICDHTSNYKGKYRVLGGVVQRQIGYTPECRNADLLIHLGQVSGAYYRFPNAPVWRVSPDGEVRDTFKNLNYVFEMRELDFFKAYNKSSSGEKRNTYFDEWKLEESRLEALNVDLPFSSSWIAQQTAGRLPENAVIHFGILNSLRMWNLFDIKGSIAGYSNVGGFGIDGCISSLIGASLANKSKLYYIVLGDLATYYDINALGNRHIGSNVRILVINNGTGFEMRHRTNRGDVFKEDADILFAAGGHFGKQSRELLKHFSTDLGFEYLAADTKEEYLKELPKFVSNTPASKPILFEVFVKVEDEYNAFEKTQYLIQGSTSVAKNTVRNLIGEKGVQTLKNMLGKR